MEIEDRYVILIGLGKFGKITVDLFNNFLEERKHQIDPKVLKKVNVYTTNFETNGPFNYTSLASQLNELVKDSQAMMFGGKFSYIFVGDLYDIGTSTYAIDYAYLPWVIDQAQSLKKKEVLGFFTYADSYGATTKANEKSMAAILNYFDNLNSIDFADSYVVPYKNPNGHAFGDVSSPTGPFERNYVIVTPGDQEAVDKYTSQVFAERIFYELFYLSSIYERVEKDKHGDRVNGKLFSSFSMIEISRLEDLQHYFLKYTREDQISDYLLSPSIEGPDLEWYRNQFFKLIDIPLDKKFPIDRAVDLFVETNKQKLFHFLDVYKSKKNSDFKNYINDCKNNIEKGLSDLSPNYTEFARMEVDYMLKTLEQGYLFLFGIKRFTGNINTYILYMENLRKVLADWGKGLQQIIDDTEDVSLEEDYQEAERKVSAIQKNFIYKIPLFVPIRRKLIENVILSLPLEEYLKKIIKKNLAKSFLDEWNKTSSTSRNPVGDCTELIDALNKMKSLMEEKKKQIQKKIQFIVDLPSYYYVIFQKEYKEYRELLTQIKSEYFGTSRKTDLENQAKEFFKTWTDGKNRQQITNSTEFMRHFDAFIENKTTALIDTAVTSGSTTDEFGRWAEDAVNQMDKRSEQLAYKSFKSDSKPVGSKKIILNPIRKTDQLSEKLKVKVTELQDVESVEVPREFTLGSIVYFQDYLWMNKDEFHKYDNLLEYKDVDSVAPKYGNNVSAGSQNIKSFSNDSAASVSIQPDESVNKTAGNDGYPTEEEMTSKDKYIRSILLDFSEPWLSISWYKTKFNEDLETLSDGQVRKLSKAIDLEELLNGMDEKPLHDFAKEINCPVTPVKARQIKMIIKVINDKM